MPVVCFALQVCKQALPMHAIYNFLPAGSLLVTAGGTDICIWSMFSSGRLVQRVIAHQKTATSVLVAALAGAKAQVLSAGLDGQIKASS